ncbi:THUMP domain-containing class I SAM-dependent RNA methyltransferase [Verticiella sediminum]|uniref:THUMP domain-containing class I SAM-dependent RNA methyltransferase n=1 Tax=Verticiella sediminum TaxID=1247510 RepID=UPI001FE976DF|nr:class I SAM-dependent RNA methyltransferase [Verticiella sediminum]
MADTPSRKTLSIKPGGSRDADPDRQRTGSRAHRIARATVRTRDEGDEQRAGERRPYPPREGNDERRRGPRPEGEGRPFERRPHAPRENRERYADSRGIDERPPRAPRGEAAERPYAGRGPRTSSAETYPVFAPCPQGLEQALADELTALGFENVSAGRAGCRFTANWTGMMRANLQSRLATRILVQVAQGPVSTEDDILALAHATPWERWFGAEQTLRVDTSAVRSPMHSLQYCNLRAKDGICDRLRDREGARPSIDTVRPDARVHLFLDETTATLYLDTSGESLFKRGWRYDKGEAPLRENLAAGLLALSGWHGDTALIDPFCGSGTILIEAAYIALRVPPGVSRPFAFERLRDHDDYLWRSLKDEARTAILPRLEIPLLGSDLDPRAIDAAQQNAERARLTPDAISFEIRDARDIRPPEGAPGWIVTNPPYGERLSADETGLWADWSQTLKAHFDGWHVDVITTDRDLPRHLRLNAQRRTPLYNGALECRLFDFEIVGGSYRQKL